MEKENFYTIRLKAECIANNRFIENVKFIYTNCTPSSLDNRDFERLCEILGFNEDTGAGALSELIKNKGNLRGFICELIERLNDNFNYNVLCIKMISIVGTKQDIIILYSYMIAKLNFEQIKAIQNQING